MEELTELAESAFDANDLLRVIQKIFFVPEIIVIVKTLLMKYLLVIKELFLTCKGSA